jgi:hypothetical protein
MGWSRELRRVERRRDAPHEKHRTRSRPVPHPRQQYFVFGSPGFPLSDLPLRQIAADAGAGLLNVRPVRVFRFEEIQEAHRILGANQAVGTMVVVLN